MVVEYVYRVVMDVIPCLAVLTRLKIASLETLGQQPTANMILSSFLGRKELTIHWLLPRTARMILISGML